MRRRLSCLVHMALVTIFCRGDVTSSRGFIENTVSGIDMSLHREMSNSLIDFSLESYRDSLRVETVPDNSNFLFKVIHHKNAFNKLNDKRIETVFLDPSPDPYIEEDEVASQESLKIDFPENSDIEAYMKVFIAIGVIFVLVLLLTLIKICLIKINLN